MAEERVDQVATSAPPYGFQLDPRRAVPKPAFWRMKCISRAYCVNNTFVDQLLPAMMRNATAPRRRRFGSCAVVGNSGTLLRRRHGAEIDGHDAVLRVQHAHLGGRWEAHTGRRTTWLIASNVWHRQYLGSCFERAAPTTPAARRLSTRDASARDASACIESRAGLWTPIIAVCNQPRIDFCHERLLSARHRRVHALNPRFLLAVRNLTEGRIPLTGAAAIAVALRSCSRVSAYGFSTNDSTACRYYWDCTSADHTYNAELGGGFHNKDANVRANAALNASRLIVWRDT